jgi:hypothetical protein
MKRKKPKKLGADEEPKTDRRVVEIHWLPRTEEEWAAFTAARLEVGRLWSTMTEMHAVVRRLRLKWPSESQWNRWAKGRFPAISAQTVQQTIAEFCSTLDATTEARKAQRAAGLEITARYPWRTPHPRAQARLWCGAGPGDIGVSCGGIL